MHNVKSILFAMFFCLGFTEAYGGGNFSNQSHKDSLTFEIFVSFDLTEEGFIENATVVKTECKEMKIKKLNAEKLKAVEKEALGALQKIPEPVGKKPARYVLPIRIVVYKKDYLKRG